MKEMLKFILLLLVAALFGMLFAELYIKEILPFDVSLILGVAFCGICGLIGVYWILYRGKQ